MTVRERILMIRLMEKLQKNPPAGEGIVVRAGNRKTREHPSRIRQGERI